LCHNCIALIYRERERHEEKRDRKKTKVGIKGAKYSYSKTQIKLADIEKHK